MSAIIAWVEQYGYFGLFSSLVLGIVGLPVPDEGLLIFAGYLVYQGHLMLFPTIATACLGSMAGISISYVIGRTIGPYFLERYAARLFSSEKLNEAHRWFERYGRWTLVFGYFIPGLRHVTALAAGTARLEPLVFASFAYTGALIWPSTFIAVGYALGEEGARASAQIYNASRIFSVLVFAAIALYVFGSTKAPKK